ncbi:hypothetical protein KSC_064110 [Ktedonobacter sp. SOSP1-52]|uniref:ester cyclase n=1 Tax=Ktedonobacter sp. SOSP1-52 TaxID=2778366 RepID=UPI0019159FFD|nr:ester cyclase [Ktedonobacter sp. SOSP1-52]GHO67519.1 hypothetical protein KSC_064110 [Ktedonobacter sp. SOSP1-52]
MTTELARGDKDIARQFYERAWNDADESAVDELLAEDFYNHELPDDNGQPHRERYKQAIRDTFTAFPDWKIDVYEIGDEGENVLMRYRCWGTHTGPGMGEPTGKRIEMEGATTVRVVNGKIHEFWKRDNSSEAWKKLRSE